MSDPLHAQLEKGLRLFNEGRFYECHDAIEEVWLQESSDRQPFLQGIIQAAVAFYHFEQGRWGAARSMFRMAIEKLEGCPDNVEGVQTGGLVEDLRQWKSLLDRRLAQGRRDGVSLPYPKLRS